MKAILLLRISSIEQELAEDIKRLALKYHKRIQSESIKRGLALKKQNG